MKTKFQVRWRREGYPKDSNVFPGVFTIEQFHALERMLKRANDGRDVVVEHENLSYKKRLRENPK